MGCTRIAHIKIQMTFLQGFNVQLQSAASQALSRFTEQLKEQLETIQASLEAQTLAKSVLELYRQYCIDYSDLIRQLNNL